jgi:hypothetical protein
MKKLFVVLLGISAPWLGAAETFQKPLMRDKITRKAEEHKARGLFSNFTIKSNDKQIVTVPRASVGRSLTLAHASQAPEIVKNIVNMKSATGENLKLLFDLLSSRELGAALFKAEKRIAPSVNEKKIITGAVKNVDAETLIQEILLANYFDVPVFVDTWIQTLPYKDIPNELIQKASEYTLNPILRGRMASLFLPKDVDIDGQTTTINKKSIKNLEQLLFILAYRKNGFTYGPTLKNIWDGLSEDIKNYLLWQKKEDSVVLSLPTGGLCELSKTVVEKSQILKIFIEDVGVNNPIAIPSQHINKVSWDKFWNLVRQKKSLESLKSSDYIDFINLQRYLHLDNNDAKNVFSNVPSEIYVSEDQYNKQIQKKFYLLDLIKSDNVDPVEITRVIYKEYFQLFKCNCINQQKQIFSMIKTKNNEKNKWEVNYWQGPGTLHKLSSRQVFLEGPYATYDLKKMSFEAWKEYLSINYVRRPKGLAIGFSEVPLTEVILPYVSSIDAVNQLSTNAVLIFENAKQIKSLNDLEEGERINFVVWSKNGKYIFVKTDKGQLYSYKFNEETKECTLHQKRKNDFAEITAITDYPTIESIAVGYKSGKIDIFNYDKITQKAWQNLLTIAEDEKPITCLAADFNRNFIMATSLHEYKIYMMKPIEIKLIENNEPNTEEKQWTLSDILKPAVLVAGATALGWQIYNYFNPKPTTQKPVTE